jgi:alkylation response protein AidB-like acyl-CoA dehydrogenase
VDLQQAPEHAILRETAERFLSERYDYRTHLKIADSERGFSPELWAAFAELGWLGLPFSEEDGGIGGSAVEIAILMDAFGKALVLEPYIPTVVLGGGLVAALGSAAQRADVLPAIAKGQRLFAFVDAPERARAQRRGGDYLISGTAKAVPGAHVADALLVAAQLPVGGAGVFLVPRDTRGLTIRVFRTVDDSRAADIAMTDMAVPASALLGGNERADDAIALAIDRAIVAASADAVGAIATMVKMTVEYAKTRVQFGQPIAKFQVLAHRMVDMKVKEEEARASGLLATLSLDGPADRRRRAVSGAKAKIGRCARFVAQSAIQTHGAIGTTSELSLGGYAKRLLAYEINYGSTREHLRRYAAMIADPAMAGAGLILDPVAAHD